MAVLTALVRLLEVKMLQMEEGTGVLEDDVKLLQVGSAPVPLGSTPACPGWGTGTRCCVSQA